MIKVENLTKKFKNGEQEIVAINDLSFSVPSGQFLTISGRSGSGKSTLLYQMGLLDMPTDGKVYIDEIESVNLSEDRRTSIRLNGLGYIFQDYAIIPYLTALENTVLPLLMQGYTEVEAEDLSKKALEKLGILDRMHNLPSQLSGGQQQRVAIARAIAHGPKIIFADEPTANLDSETAQNVIDAFIDLNKEGQTIVMVTHEPEYASLAHRTIIMDDGVIVEDKMNS